MKLSKAGLIGEGVNFQRVRRITGYLVQTISGMNNAKRAEVADRVTHGGEAGGAQALIRDLTDMRTSSRGIDVHKAESAPEKATLDAACGVIELRELQAETCEPDNAADETANAKVPLTEVVLDDGRITNVKLLEMQDAQLPRAPIIGTCCGHPVYEGDDGPYMSRTVEHDLHQVANTLQAYGTYDELDEEW